MSHSDRCAQCAAAWSVDDTPNNRDSVLEAFLNQIVAEATNLGRCYTDPLQLILGSNVDHSIGWHANRLSVVDGLKVQIHDHIRQNYERDD